MSRMRIVAVGLGTLLSAASAYPAAAQYYNRDRSSGYSEHQARVGIMQDRRALAAQDHAARVDIMNRRRALAAQDHAARVDIMNQRQELMNSRRGYGNGYGSRYGYNNRYNNW